MQLKVWQLIDSSSVGGIETHVVHLSRGLQARGIDNTIVQLKRYGEHPVFNSVEHDDLSIEQRRGIGDTLGYCLQDKPDVIHAHGAKACLIAKFLRVTTGQKIVCTYHTGETAPGLQGIYDRINEASAFIGQSIAVSDPIAEKLVGDIKRVDNFIPLPDIVRDDTDKKAIAFVGRLSHEKGPDRFKQLAEQNPDLSFAIYGRGPLLSEVERNQPNNLTLHTNVNSMDDHWESIDLLCITSRQEGLPLVAIEAMARGICVVSFPVGGLPSLIKHQQNGFILAHESVTEMSAFLKVFRLLSQSQRAPIANNARATIAANYSTDALIPRIIATYQTGELEYVA